MQKAKFQIKPTPLDLPLALFFLAALLSISAGYQSERAVLPLAVLAGCLGLYLVVSRLNRAEPALRWTARAAVLLAALAGLFFITQSGRYDTLEKIGPLSRLAAAIARLFPAAGFWTPVGNSMATLLEGLLFLSIGLVLVEKRRNLRAAAAVGAGIIAFALLLSQSRGAWLGLLGAGLVWLAVSWRPARWLASAAGLGLLALAVYVLVQGNIQALDRVPLVNRTIAPLFIRPDRLDVYRGSLSLLRDVPFTGIGLGEQFPMNYSRYVLLIQVPYLSYSHNFYLETWLQLGLLGMTALIWLAGTVIYSALRLLRTNRDPLIESAWAGLAAMFIHGLTDARPYVDLWCWLPFFLLAGLVSAGWLRSSPSARWSWIPAAAAGLFAVFALASLGSLPAAWQANLGSLEQARAELDELASPAARSEHLRSAAVHFERSLAADPGQRSANLRLGLMEIDREQFPDAVRHLEAAHRAEQRNLTAIKALGLAYTWAGQLEKAAALLGSTPGMDQELNNYGFWRASRGQGELSRNAYRVSLLLNPNQPQIDQALQQLPAP